MPFSFKQLFQTSVHVFQQYWRTFFLFSLILLIPTFLLNIVGAIFGINQFTLILQTVALIDMIYVAPIVAILLLLGMVLILPVVIFVYSWYNQQPISGVKEAFQKTRGVWKTGIWTSIVSVLIKTLFIFIFGVILSIVFSLFVSESALRANFNNMLVLLTGLAAFGLVFVYQALIIKQKKGIAAVIESVSSLRRNGWRALSAVIVALAVTTGVGMAMQFFSDRVILFVSERMVNSLVGLNYVTAFLSLPFRYVELVVMVWSVVVVTLVYAFYADPPTDTVTSA